MPTKTAESAALRIALSYARGSYQRAIVLGRARVSGSDLKGNARKYGGRYKRSRDAVLGRIAADARIVVRIDRSRPGPDTLQIEPSALLALAYEV